LGDFLGDTFDFLGERERDFFGDRERFFAIFIIRKKIK
jgi:hypothetical protein